MDRRGRNLLTKLSSELGFRTLRNSSRDVHLLLLARFLRMAAYGSSTLILALFFQVLGHSDTQIGLFMTLTLAGDVLISLGFTFIADALGRRMVLFLGSILMTFSGCIFAMFANYTILLLAAIVGVISPSGNEIGPFRAVEESTLAQLSDADTRSDIFAWYVVIGTLGTATGSFGGGWLVQFLEGSWRPITAYKFIFWIYAVVGLLKASLCVLLSDKCEVQNAPSATAAPSSSAAGQRRNSNENSEAEEPFLPQNGSSTVPSSSPAKPTPPPKPSPLSVSRLSPNSRKTLAKLCALFFFDSLASGMVPYSLIALFMERKFRMPEGKLGTIMATAQFVSSMGSLLASAVAKRIGLVRAMVFTHLPSAIFLALVPLPPQLGWTIFLLVARASLGSMDQAPRSAFLSAVVLPEERTVTMGIVNTVKTMSQSSGPLITGSLAASARFWIAFVVAGSLKAFYDLGMLTMFVNLKLEGDKGARRAEVDEEEHEQFALEPLDDDDDEEGEEEGEEGKGKHEGTK